MRPGKSFRTWERAYSRDGHCARRELSLRIDLASRGLDRGSCSDIADGHGHRCHTIQYALGGLM